jgi:crotonobetainyl-CoA:carnitine CoA-transferase CaiB-like acyl-CoA transferase
MLEALGEWMSYPLYYTYDGAAPPPRNGAAHATIYPYGPFVAADGKVVLLGLQNEREWVSFCEVVLQQPALATDPRFANNSLRNQHRAELKAIVLDTFGRLTAAQLIERLEQAQIANAQVNTLADVWAHPQLHARKRFTEVDSTAGPLQVLLPPGVNSSFEYRMDAVPAVGEQTEAILRQLGRSELQIASLRGSGAV